MEYSYLNAVLCVTEIWFIGTRSMASTWDFITNSYSRAGACAQSFMVSSLTPPVPRRVRRVNQGQLVFGNWSPGRFKSFSFICSQHWPSLKYQVLPTRKVDGVEQASSLQPQAGSCPDFFLNICSYDYLVVLGLPCFVGLSLVAASGDTLPCCAWASHCSAFFCCRTRVLGT